MKPAAFEYHAPETVADVASLLAEHGDDAKVLAGGQSLVPLLAMRLTRFPHIIDLNRVEELRGIERQNGHLTIRAMTRQAAAEYDTTVASAAPLVARALPMIGHFQIRNRGTVGGSIAHADSASELPAVALALDAELEAARAGSSRRIPAADFFEGTWTTTLEPEELLTAIHFPVWEGRCGFVVDEIARRSGDFALAGVACAVALERRGRGQSLRDRAVRYGPHAGPRGGRRGRAQWHRALNRGPHRDRAPRGRRLRSERRRARVGGVPNERGRASRAARARTSVGRRTEWLTKRSS